LLFFFPFSFSLSPSHCHSSPSCSCPHECAFRIPKVNYAKRQIYVCIPFVIRSPRADGIWLRHQNTFRDVAGSIPDEGIGYFH
jgi:hypothetical protein